MTKFVIVIKGGTPEIRNAITTHFDKKGGWGFWHHFEDLWFLDTTESTTSQAVSSEIESIVGEISHVVIGLHANEKITHWGRAPKSGWAWMKKSFGTPE